METLIVFFPFLGFLACLFFSWYLGSFWSSIIATLLVFTSFIFSLFSFINVSFNHNVVYIELFDWFTIFPLSVKWGIFLDTLTSVMLLVVLCISSIVHIYSIDYMASDPHKGRFFSYLSLFTFFMIVLVVSPNFFQLFVGWEGVGVCSYLLISFWFTRKQALKSALKAMVVNRVGDFGLLIAISFIFITCGTLDFCSVFTLSSSLNNHLLSFFTFPFSFHDLVSFFLLFGAMGKSAQIGLHTWLPDAMEGPTPVSALIHAATMVTAGIFLLVRVSPIIEYSDLVLVLTSFIGALTAFFAATVGLFQSDLKKVIAYSTCSQLGYMVFACGVSSYSVAIFHLYNHAFFKALLFLGAGAIIHAFGDEQDMRKLGGLTKLLPFSYSVMLVGSLSLSGFPFLTGFYSKDLILERTSSLFTQIGIFSNWLGIITAFITAFYSVRLLYFTFFSLPRGSYSSYIFIGTQDAPFFMSLCLLFLAVCSIIVGFFSRELFVGLGTDFWKFSIFVKLEHMNVLESEFLSAFDKFCPVFLSITGGLLSFLIHYFFFYFVVQLQLKSCYRRLYVFFNQKWFFDQFYNKIFSFPALKFGYVVGFREIDRGFIEFFGPTGLSQVGNFMVLSISKFQSGFLYHYMFLMVLVSVSFFFMFLGIASGFTLKIFFICVIIGLITQMKKDNESSKI